MQCNSYCKRIVKIGRRFCCCFSQSVVSIKLIIIILIIIIIIINVDRDISPVARPQIISEIVVAGANLKPMAVIKSLGIILDSRWSFTAHVIAECKACYYHMALRHIRHLLTQSRRRTSPTHYSMQHRGSTHWLLQLNLARCINVVDYQAATCAELVGSCGAATTETNSRGAPSAVTSLAACRTSGDLVTCKLAVLTFYMRLTATPAYLNSLISNRVTGI